MQIILSSRQSLESIRCLIREESARISKTWMTLKRAKRLQPEDLIMGGAVKGCRSKEGHTVNPAGGADEHGRNRLRLPVLTESAFLYQLSQTTLRGSLGRSVLNVFVVLTCTFQHTACSHWSVNTLTETRASLKLYLSCDKCGLKIDGMDDIQFGV